MSAALRSVPLPAKDCGGIRYQIIRCIIGFFRTEGAGRGRLWALSFWRWFLSGQNLPDDLFGLAAVRVSPALQGGLFPGISQDGVHKILRLAAAPLLLQNPD